MVCTCYYFITTTKPLINNYNPTPLHTRYVATSGKNASVIASSEPLQTRAYHKDLKWRMVYQREMLRLPYQQIAVNLGVDSSIVWRAVKRLEDEGTVASKKNVTEYMNSFPL